MYLSHGTRLVGLAACAEPTIVLMTCHIDSCQLAKHLRARLLFVTQME